MVIFSPGGGTWAYSSAHFAVRVSRDTRSGGGGLLAASLYHPHIWTHAFLKRGGTQYRSLTPPPFSSNMC